LTPDLSVAHDPHRPRGGGCPQRCSTARCASSAA
jgi:hypothetical protein